MSDNYGDFIDQLCYIQNTYHIPKSDSVPHDSVYRRERTIKYYQWINFVLLLQALGFRVPKWIWQAFYNRIGPGLGNLVDASKKFGSYNDDDAHASDPSSSIIAYISNCLQRYADYIEVPKRGCLRRSGASLAYLYMFVKCLYVCNLLAQMAFLQYFLSYNHIDYLYYGFHVMLEAWRTWSIPESRLFPHVTLCDFRVRELGHAHSYTVECILVVNIFIEKIYFILWLWLGVLLVVTVVDLVRLAYVFFPRHSRSHFVRMHLELLVKAPDRASARFERWLSQCPTDSLCALRIISANTSSELCAQVLHRLVTREPETA